MGEINSFSLEFNAGSDQDIVLETEKMMQNTINDAPASYVAVTESLKHVKKEESAGELPRVDAAPLSDDYLDALAKNFQNSRES